MNATFPTPGLSDRRFTAADIQALVMKGVIREDAKFELVGGDIVPLSPKGPRHEGMRLTVTHWIRRLPLRIASLAETTLWLDEHNFLEPDYVLFDRSVAIADLKASDVLLAIEVGDHSWRYDTEAKAALFAKHGVQEYWAIHAPTRLLRLHRGPSAHGWAEVKDIAAGDAVTPLHAGLPTFTL